ncbi:DUF6049 family protein [Krasilnikoviella flava]|uniref:Uncharacterized protein n=1 Tax=Krasilnikoviella flava TaxID=526729 RepID=A0A1T5KC55_9MICO|nr:DUF6049 family protein [Krasilnikoviella flava]SKC61257.1 hypothetical protein SAMN04324258_2055 [Krasilnikoviella flava]
MTTSRPPGAVAAPAPTPARPARLLTVLLLLAALLGAGALVALPVGPASASPGAVTAPAARDGAATVELVRSTPTLAVPGSTVTLTVRVTNGTDAALDGAALDLGVSWRPITSREDLSAWADDDGAGTAASQVVEPVDRLAPGDSAQVQLELEVDALGLSADNPWGPREMSVALTRDGAALDVLHTFLLFAPEDTAPDPVAVSVAAPVTGPAVDPLDPDGYDLDLATDTASDGRLSRLLDAAAVTGTSPGMSLAVDPALVAAAAGTDDTDAQAWATRLTGAPVTGDEDATADATATSASLSSTAADAAASGEPADVAVLPGFDPDLAAVAHADPSRADVAAATGGEAALGGSWQRPEDWDLTVAWPVGRPDAATLAVGRAAPVDQVVVAAGLAPTDGAPASARTAVETPSGKVSALVADAGLSAGFAALTDGDSAPSAAEASTRILADAALLALQQQDAGTQDLHVLAALPRGWSPDPALVGTVLDDLDGASWADVVPLTETVAAPASRVPRDGPARAGRSGDGELAPPSVRRLLDSHRDLSAFSTVASDPVELSGDTDQALVAPLAVAARTAPDTRDHAVDLAVERSDALQQGIGVADRSNITLVSDTGKLPVTVSNELPVDATVTVVLRPDASRLVVESRPTVVVPAGTSTNVHVPVRAIGSGDVDLQVEVLAPSGAVVAGPTSFAVRVRAGWETAGTAVVAALVALLFLGGIWRTVRRGRSSARTTDEGVADDAADPQGPDDADPPHTDPAAVPRDGAHDDQPNAPHDPGGGAPPAARTPPAQATETDPS